MVTESRLLGPVQINISWQNRESQRTPRPELAGIPLTKEMCNELQKHFDVVGENLNTSTPFHDIVKPLDKKTGLSPKPSGNRSQLLLVPVFPKQLLGALWK